MDGLAIHLRWPVGVDYARVAEAYGLRTRWANQAWLHGRFAGTMLQAAAMAVAGGSHGEAPHHGLTSPMSGAALAMQRYMAVHGATSEQLGAIAIRLRAARPWHQPADVVIAVHSRNRGLSQGRRRERQLFDPEFLQWGTTWATRSSSPMRSDHAHRCAWRNADSACSAKRRRFIKQWRYALRSIHSQRATSTFTGSQRADSETRAPKTSSGSTAIVAS